MTGIAWVGAKRGGIYAGTLPTGCGALMYQMEGHRYVACLPVMECLGMMHRHDDASIPEHIDADMAPDMIEDQSTSEL